MSTRLAETISRIKAVLAAKKREISLFLLFFLISSLSFGIGFLYAEDQNVAPIIIEKKC